MQHFDDVFGAIAVNFDVAGDCIDNHVGYGMETASNSLNNLKTTLRMKID